MADQEELNTGSENPPASEEEQISSPLGLQRWVQFTFIMAGLVAFWLADKLVAGVWNLFDDPNPNAVTAAAAFLGLATGVGLSKHAGIRRFVNESAGELARVTWPTKTETRSNTIIVAVFSLICAFIIFGFDAVWSQLTDLIYSRG